MWHYSNIEAEEQYIFSHQSFNEDILFNRTIWISGRKFEVGTERMEKNVAIRDSQLF